MKPSKPQKAIILPKEQELMARAFSAWFRFCSTTDRLEYPGPQSAIEQHRGHPYVVLRNSSKRVLAVYRVRNDGVLKSLKRYPEALRGT
jgi:hypothetical protein